MNISIIIQLRTCKIWTGIITHNFNRYVLQKKIIYITKYIIHITVTC